MAEKVLSVSFVQNFISALSIQAENTYLLQMNQGKAYVELLVIAALECTQAGIPGLAEESLRIAYELAQKFPQPNDLMDMVGQAALELGLQIWR